MTPPPPPADPTAALRPGQRLAVIDADGSVVQILGAISPTPGECPTPEAPVIRMTAYKHTRELRVVCPYCAEEHWHGYGYATRDREQYRLSHCGRGTYRIIAPPSTAIVQPGRAGRRGRSA